MARANPVRYGLRYVGSTFAENVTPRLLDCQVATNYGTALYMGDPVKMVSDGSVAQSAAGDPVFGVIAGVGYRNADGVFVEKNYVPANTTYTPDRLRTIVRVVPATPFTIFEVDADDGSSITTVAAARALVWENCDHIFTNAGTAATGLSGVQLDISTHGTATAQWRIFSVSPLTVGNDLTQISAKYWVVANETHNWPGTFSTTGI